MLADKAFGSGFGDQDFDFQLTGLGLARWEQRQSANQLLVECEREFQCLERSKCLSSSFAVHYPASSIPRPQGVRGGHYFGRLRMARSRGNNGSQGDRAGVSRTVADAVHGVEDHFDGCLGGQDTQLEFLLGPHHWLQQLQLF